MTPPTGSLLSPTGQEVVIAVPVVTIMPAGLDWAVIVPTEPVDLPAALLADARRYHAREMEARARARFLVQSFEDWLSDCIRDHVYGPGCDPGAAQDWMER